MARAAMGSVESCERAAARPDRKRRNRERATRGRALARSSYRRAAREQKIAGAGEKPASGDVAARKVGAPQRPDRRQIFRAVEREHIERAPSSICRVDGDGIHNILPSTASTLRYLVAAWFWVGRGVSFTRGRAKGLVEYVGRLQGARIARGVARVHCSLPRARASSDVIGRRRIAHTRPIMSECSPAVSRKTAMHPVRGDAIPYSLQPANIGRGLSETRDVRKGNLYLVAAWFSGGTRGLVYERARKGAGGMCWQSLSSQSHGAG